MPSRGLNEENLENSCLEMLEKMGYVILSGPDISPEGLYPERQFSEVVLKNRLWEALQRINPKIPRDAIEEAIRKVMRIESQETITNNQNFHRLLFNGIDVEYRNNDNKVKSGKVWLFDFEQTSNNEFLAVNQFTIIIDRFNRRPDITLFVNGIPLVLMELKNPAKEYTNVRGAYNQIRTYINELPLLFRHIEFLIISDGLNARAGTISSDFQRFMPWKTVNGKKSEKNTPEIETLFNGMLRPDILLDIVRHFIVYESEKDTVNNVTKTVKKLAAYHQYNAVNNALESTTKARAKSKKAGIIWHTQGSGKSLTMIFYAAKLALSEKMENPTIVVLTDRNDLDGQLFGTFSRCEELLRQNPKQAESRAELTKMLNVSSGGIYFTTIQKFLPEVNSREFPKISERDNIVVIADEAHRSQYGFGLKTKITGKEENTEAALKYGYAKYLRDALPNATFIGFTGTPIETADKSTPAVFGPVVDVYDIKQSVDDGNTVKIYYENRLVEIRLKPEEMPKIDPEFDEVTEGEEEEYKEKQKTKWSTLEKVVGTDERIKRLSKDFVEHWEKRLSAMKGKAMVVAMSRRIAVQLHNEIVKLRPDWYNKEDENGVIKVIMTGSASDEQKWQEHIRNKARRDAIGDRFKDPDDPLKVVIVRDMWLTGFDVPSLNTIYIDKPMKGHTLMQAIARVNRVFKDKPGGLVVDYIGIGTDLKEAMSQYSEGDQKEAGIDVKEAIKLMLEKYEVVACMFHGFDFSHFFDAAANEKIRIMLDASDFILTSEENKKRFLTNVSALSKAYSLAVPSEESSRIRDDVGFFQAVRAAIMKNSEEGEREYRNIDTAINQIVSKSIVSDRVIDIFAAVGSENPDLSILSDTFLSEIEHMERKNLAYEALKRLLADQIRIRSKKNIIKGRSFAELLDKTVKRYIGRSIDAAKAIEELIQLAKEIREETNRGRDMGLSEDEVAFFDALADHKNAKDVLGDDTLRTIAKELVRALRKNVTIDWTIRESVQAQMRLMIRKILKKYHYPPDGEEKATDTVLDQAKRFAAEWSSNI